MNANDIAPAFGANENNPQFQHFARAVALENIDAASLKRMTLPLLDWIQLVSLVVADSVSVESVAVASDAAGGPNGIIQNKNRPKISPVDKTTKHGQERYFPSIKICNIESREARKAYATTCLELTKLLIDRLVLNDFLDDMLNRVTCYNDFIQPQDISMENLMVELVHLENAMDAVGFNSIDELIDHSHSHDRGNEDPVDRKQLSISKILQKCSPVQIRQILGTISGIEFSSQSPRLKRRLSSSETLSDEYYKQIGLILFGLFSRGSSLHDDVKSEITENNVECRSRRGASSKTIRAHLADNYSGNHVKIISQHDRSIDSDGDNHGRQTHMLSQTCKSMKRMNLSNLQQDLQNHSILLPISRLIADLIECDNLTNINGKFLYLEDIRYEINQMMNETEFFLTDDYRTKMNIDKPEIRHDFLYGRSDDMKALKRVASMSRTDGHFNINNVVFLRGDPGVGKSRLVKSLKVPLISEGWLFFSCKFDRIAQSEPLSIVSSGLNSFLGNLADLKEGIEDFRLDNDQNMRNVRIGPDEEYMNATIISIERFLSASGIVVLSDFIPSLKRLFPEIFQSVIKDDESDSDEESATCTICDHDGSDCKSKDKNCDTDLLNKCDMNIAQAQEGCSGGNNETIEHEDEDSEENEDTCLTANTFRNRLHYLFRRLLRALSSPWQHPILFFADDIQWADSASLELISSLVLDFDHLNDADRQETPQCLMLVGAYRPDEVNSNHMLNHCIESFQTSASARVTNFDLGGLTKSSTIEMISDSLKLPIRLTRDLAGIVHTKTLGNPLFVKMFMTSLLDDHKISYNLTDRCWKWDIEDVKSVSIHETVATIMSKRISRLPTVVIEALVVASCFGVKVDDQVLCSLSVFERFCDIIPCLEHAMQEGIIEKHNETYVFAHDTIQQTVYDLLPPETMEQYHFEIGLQLLKEITEDNKCNRVSFIAIDQINKAKNIDADEIEPKMRELIVSVNVKAAERAIERSDASSALAYVEHGKHFLGNDGWTEFYDDCLRLNDAACLASYLVGSPVEVSKYYDEIKHHAVGFEDKMKSRCILIQTCASSGDVQGAIDFGLDLLDGLDEYFPFEVTQEDIHAAVKLTKALISDDPKSQILNAPKLSEQKELWCLKLMGLLLPFTYVVRPDYLSLIGTKMTEISFRHGFAQESALALTAFGITYISALNDVDEGYRWSKLSLLVIERFKAQSLYPKVYYAINFFALIWKEPLQALVDGLRQNHRSALLVGDIEYASFSSKAYIERSVLCGNPLETIEKECTSLSLEMVCMNS